MSCTIFLNVSLRRPTRAPFRKFVSLASGGALEAGDQKNLTLAIGKGRHRHPVSESIPTTRGAIAARLQAACQWCDAASRRGLATFDR